MEPESGLAFSGLPAQVHVAVGKEGAVERLVAKVVEVIGKHVLGLDAEIVAQIAQMVMGEVTVHQRAVLLVSLAAEVVVGRGVLYPDVARAKHHAVAIQAVGCAQHVHLHRGFFGDEVAFQVDLLEGAEHAGVPCGPSLQVGENGGGELVQEEQVDAFGMDVQVQSAPRVMSGGDGALELGMVAGLAVTHVCFQLDAFSPVPPSGMHVHLSHQALVDAEVLHVEKGIRYGRFQQVLGIDEPCGTARKLQRLEVYHLKDIVEVDIVEIHRYGVVLPLRHDAVHHQVSLALADACLLDAGCPFAVDDGGGVHVPQGIADGNLCGRHAGLYHCLSCFVSHECGCHIQRSRLCRLPFVVPFEHASQAVVAGKVLHCHLDGPLLDDTLQGELLLHHLGLVVDVQADVFQGFTAVEDFGAFGLHFQDAERCVEPCVQAGGEGRFQMDAGQPSQQHGILQGELQCHLLVVGVLAVSADELR